MNYKNIRFFSYLAVFIQGMAFWRTPVHDPDLGFHLLGAAWIDKTGQVPRTDFMNAFNNSWIDYHWLGQLIIYYFYKWQGLPAVQAFCGIVIALLALVILRIAEVSTKKESMLIPFLLTTVVLFILFGKVSSRPTTIAVLLVVTAYLVLITKRERSLWLLFGLAVFCANVHIYWVLIPGLWLVFASCWRAQSKLDATISDVSPLKSWGGFFLLLAAGLISPYGIFSSEAGFSAKLANYFAFIDVSTMPADLKYWIDELKSGIATKSIFLWYSLFSLIVVVRMLSKKIVISDLPLIILFVGTGWMAIDALKYIPFFLVASLPLTVTALENIALFDYFKKRMSILVLPIISLVYFVPLSFSSFPLLAENANKSLVELHQAQPIEVCRQIPKLIISQRKNPRIMTFYHFGSWCSWALNQEQLPSRYQVTMDGRTQFVPAKFLVDQFRMFQLYNGWEETFNSLDADAVLVGYGQPLSQMLVRMPDKWKPVFVDNNFALFAKQ